MSLPLYLTLVIAALALIREDKLAPGLVATYRDSSHRVRLVVPAPSFYLGARDSIHPAIALEFEAEWSGLLSVLEGGDYKFQCACDVEVAGQRAGAAAVRLTAGKHPLRLRYRRPSGRAQLMLEWRSEKFPLEPVPSARFEHRADEGPGPEELLVERGRDLIEHLGCANCHRSEAPSPARHAGPRLTGIGGRTNERWLLGWLTDPSAFRPDATMPSTLDEAGRRDVSRYLASLPGPRFQTAAASPEDVDRGRRLYGTIGCAACHSSSRTPLEGLGSKSTIAALAAYLKDPSRYDPGGRMPSMLLSDEESAQVAAFLVQSRNPQFERAAEGGNAARGKALVRSAGCLACHDLEDPFPVVNEARAPRLEVLDGKRGCLADEPHGVPRYRLASGDREALVTYLGSYRAHPDRWPAPVFKFRRDLGRFGCTSCHQLDRQHPTGSPAEAAPPLTDTGAKLRTRWIAEVLGSRKRVQNYLELRMPDYDARATRDLPDGFSLAFGLEPGDGPAAPRSSDSEGARGIDLVGMNVRKGAMACLGCHDWGDFKSQGEHAPQLIDAADRLRYDWYVRWMRDPARILSGTSMPAYFRNKPPDEGDRVIHTLWAALAMGERAPLPEGLKAPGGALGSEERPVPELEPIVVRWDMPEATPAAIAVGMPGKVSYCFDAGEVRLLYAWAGGFVNLSGTLRRKTDANRITPTAQLIGDVFFRAAEFPWRVDAPDRLPSRRFRGYRLVGGYPEFHYSMDGIDVYERIVPAAGGTGIVRELRVAPGDRAVWFVAGEPHGARIRSSLGSLVNGRIELPRGRDLRFDVTIDKAQRR